MKLDVVELWSWIPNRTLYTLHLGVKKNIEKAFLEGDAEVLLMQEKINQVKSEIVKHNLIQPKAIFKWFDCQRSNNQINIKIKKDVEYPVKFPRQVGKEGRCLADYVVTHGGRIGALVTTAGDLHPTLQEWVRKRRYQDAMILNALWVQTAEALAERIHYQMRIDSGSVENKPSHQDIERANYSGKRFSYGYSACPNLEDQVHFSNILDIGSIGVSITSTMMIHPEASVTAWVFDNNKAEYFSL